ncbi:hypothetical protein HDK90DRAFT_9772 [Phyllosticta capitalensis]|uniref:Uncharacterized protein n=1 Tax=Phyllosticta capitalensis TaxID=121624 RepID=A0ABR1Z226_9PEZI
MSKPELEQSLPGKQRSFTTSVPPPCLAVKPPVLASNGTQCNACTSPWPRQQPPKLIEASYQWLMVFGSITSTNACPNAIRLLSLDIEQSATQKSPSLHTSVSPNHSSCIVPYRGAPHATGAELNAPRFRRSRNAFLQLRHHREARHRRVALHPVALLPSPVVLRPAPEFLSACPAGRIPYSVCLLVLASISKQLCDEAGAQHRERKQSASQTMWRSFWKGRVAHKLYLNDGIGQHQSHKVKLQSEPGTLERGRQ